MTIDEESLLVTIYPKSESHEGRDFSVFINANLAVNTTIQSPMSALAPAFDILVLTDGSSVRNTAPYIENAITNVVAIVDEEVQIIAGTPKDDDGDLVYVKDWGV